ncbi:PDR/VanB family oxidoreductase [Streptomyces sp. NPDC004237]|uniref:PDR/VanB family oxidoreductase n=1 Tax=Streptomyces sp. NPDC004237 TaxID=3154455 RepID=UPI0033A18768
MTPRLRTVVAVAGAALLVRRAMRRRIEASPLWPMPALEPPTSGQPRSRALRPLVTSHKTVADGVVQLRLEARRLPGWEPGAHLDVVLPSGLVRQYSLCGDPADTSSYTIAARLVADGRGGSREVHEQVVEGMELEVRGPRNRFALVGAASYVFVAGGIGITPILSMVRALPEGTAWRLLYCGRSRASMPFLAELAGDDRVTVLAEDEDGRPDLDALTVPEGTAVYCCGPEGLMAAVEERFPAVELRRSGRTLTVPADTTVLAAVRAELPDTAYSCAQGFCGTCQQRVLEGEVEHRDELLTDAERADSMLICVSRARSGRLVLDL